MDKIVVDELDKEVIIKLPINTKMIGRVCSEACLAPGSPYKVIRFDGEEGKKVGKSVDVKGIIYPTAIPKMDDDLPCRHLCKKIIKGFFVPKHYIHTGICLDESTTVIDNLIPPSASGLDKKFQSLLPSTFSGSGYTNYCAIPDGEDTNNTQTVSIQKAAEKHRSNQGW